MQCVTLTEKNVIDLLQSAEKYDFVELRLESLTEESPNFKLLRGLRTSGKRVICRYRSTHSDAKRRWKLLTEAAAWVATDIEVEDSDSDALLSAIKIVNPKIRLIVAAYRYGECPNVSDLKSIQKECFERGAVVVKLACSVRTVKEASRVLTLLDHEHPTVVVGVGEAGRILRVTAPLLGSPFTYVIPDNEEAKVLGQIKVSEYTAVQAGMRVLADF